MAATSSPPPPSILNSDLTCDKWQLQIKDNVKLDLETIIQSLLCVFQVPASLKTTKPESYSPQLIALGPFHHFRPELYQIEPLKLAISNRALERFNLPGFDDFIALLSPSLPRIQAYYGRNLDLNDKTLAWIIAIDGLFFVEILYNEEMLIPTSVPYFFDSSKRKLSPHAILNDLVLLENQIPLFLLAELPVEFPPYVKRRHLLDRLYLLIIWRDHIETKPIVIKADGELHGQVNRSVDVRAPTSVGILQNIAAGMLKKVEDAHMDVETACSGGSRESLYQCRGESESVSVVIDTENFQDPEPSGTAAVANGRRFQTLRMAKAATFRRKDIESIVATMEKEGEDGVGFVFADAAKARMETRTMEAAAAAGSGENDRRDGGGGGDDNFAKKFLKKVASVEIGPDEGVTRGVEAFAEGQGRLPITGIFQVFTMLNKVLEEDRCLVPSASQLKNVSVKISSTSSGGGGGLSGIKFDLPSKTLYLPTFTWSPNSEVVLRNLVAYEATAKSNSLILTRYTELMHGLVRTSEDVRLLKKEGVLVLDYGRERCVDEATLVEMFGGMGMSTSYPKDWTILDPSVAGINEYYNNKVKILMSRLFKKYAKVTIKVLVLAAGVILVMVIFIQAFCSVYRCNGNFGSRLLRLLGGAPVLFGDA
ncbi:Putative UPF0481 protein At3g02645 [Linum grandiflorum]